MREFWCIEEKNLYTVIADSRRAKIFAKRIGDKSEIVLVKEMVSTHFKALHNEISDEKRDNFAQGISQMLNDIDIENIENIILIAPPKIQKLICDHLDNEALQKLTSKVSEDIVWMEARDINRYVNKLIFRSAA